MHKIKFVIAVSITTVLSGCTALSKNCPDDPFDPSASGFSRLFCTENQQQGRLDKESGKGASLEKEGTALADESEKKKAEVAASNAEIAKLKSELAAQNKRVYLAESRLATLRASGAKSDAELALIESRIAEVKRKAAEASDGSDDLGSLRKLRDDMEAELDLLLEIE